MSDKPPIYYSEHGFIYVRVSELPESERPFFERWLFGQTRPLLGLELEDAAYAHDYRRWIEQGKRLEQRQVDWD